RARATNCSSTPSHGCVQFTLICADEHVDGIVDIICNAARTGAVGDGKIWVEPVEEVIRIRTGEHGPAAV
ncbi:MAG: P-II family nitrogen regulator, partial [Collinsella sp.]